MTVIFWKSTGPRDQSAECDPAFAHRDGGPHHFGNPGVPSEVRVGIEHGLKHFSAVNFDHVQTVDRARLKGLVGHVDDNLMNEVCQALAVATGCPEPS